MKEKGKNKLSGHMGFTWYCSIILRVFDYWDYFQEVMENTTEG